MGSTKQGPWGLTETSAAITESAWVCTRSSVCVLWLIAWCLGETPNSESGGVSDSIAYSWDHFPPSGLLHPGLEVRVCACSYHILLCPVPLMSLEGLLFSGGGECSGGGMWIWGNQEVGRRDWRCGGRGSSIREVLYERGIHLKN